MRLHWTPQALSDVADVLGYIADEDPQAAAQFQSRLFELLEDNLINQPTMGRPGRVSGTRELLVHRHYILAYRLRGEAIELLAFRHSARLWPDGFQE